MRRLHTRAATSRALAALPAAVAGTIALALSATPAHAADSRLGSVREADRPTGKTPAVGVTPFAPALRAATEVPGSHTVVAGDTVSGIAERYGLTTDAVLGANGLDRSSIIRPGQVLALTAASAPAPAPAAPPAASGYTVAAGDTISAIASRHGTSIQAVLDANGLTRASIIYPGQTLSIPGAAAAASAPPPAVAPAAPAPAPAPPVTAGYTVAAGDTISGIASRHGTSTQALLDANGLTRASIIYPGQTIAIPGAGMAPAASVAPAPAPAPAPAAPTTALDAEQSENARLIIRVGREVGASDRAIAIALGTAMQESWLRNLDWGDRDSLGLFQQRPSQGWGSETEVRDAARSTRAFFGGASDPNGDLTRGLYDIGGWESLSFADAAQAVQISAYPDRYAQWEQPAYAWLAAHG